MTFNTRRGRRTCFTCSHPERETIDQRLAAGEGPTRIAREYRLSKDSVKGHKANHLGQLLAASLRGEYAGDVSAVRSISFTVRRPEPEKPPVTEKPGDVDKC